MKKKLTKQQEYNHQYYLAHKHDAKYKARRARIEKKYRAKDSVKKRRNARIRARWATDEAFRQHLSEYQKLWRKKKKLAAKKSLKKIARNRKRAHNHAG